jgi:hypothetical protein
LPTGGNGGVLDDQQSCGWQAHQPGPGNEGRLSGLSQDVDRIG